MKNNRLFLILSLCASLGSCGNADRTQDDSPDNYQLFTVTASDVTLPTTYSAAVRGKQDIEVRPQIAGLIVEVCVTEGEYVRKGQPLFMIDQTAYKAILDEAYAQMGVAKAELATARMNAENERVLCQKQIISESQLRATENALASREAMLAQAEAQVRNATNNLSYTVIKSPSDGVVGTLPYRIGALVSPEIEQPLTTVSDNSEMYVYFSLTEKQIYDLLQQHSNFSQMIESMPAVQLRLNNGSLYPSAGRIVSISGVINPTIGTVSVRAVFPNKDGLLLSGASGEVVIPLTRRRVVTIPQTSTFEIQDKFFVYKSVQGKAASTEIQVSSAGDGKNYIVESGLHPGDRIVSEGVTTLHEGTVVEPSKQ